MKFRTGFATALLGASMAIASPLFVAAALAQGGPGGPPPVTVAKPVVKDVVEQDEFTGRFEAVDSVDLRARVSGYLEAVKFRDGEIVKAGDLLFVIDKRPYSATFSRAQAAVNAAQTRVDFARGDLDRYERLARSGTAPERQLEQARQTFQQAQADIAGLRADLESARLNLGFTDIRSPITGRIGRKLVSEGNLVAADQTLLATVVSTDPIHFYFDIDERSFIAYTRMTADGNRPNGRDAGGFEVFAGLLDERDLPRKGRVEFLDNRIDPASGTMRARATFENRDGLLTPGLFGRIRVPGSNAYKAVLVPDEAISADQDRRLVWVVAADGSVAVRLVRPGPRIDGYRVIRNGLDGSETIVIAGLQRVRPGGKVTPQPVELPAKR
ncbi:MAG: efflux RND transporter periplasmic adaptor subunit [Rhodospirillales bacterium]|nr:efflux RND transporter periplasmic adaptor subunit [Rhodospirillales bacterium]